MPTCHKCPFARQFSAGSFRDLPWEKTPCATCNWTGEQINHHGASHISIDAMSDDGEQSLGMVEATSIPVVRDMSSARRVGVSPEIASMAINAGLRRMTDSQRDVAMMFLANPGETQESIAKRLGKTPQLVSAMFKVCRRIWQEAADELSDLTRKPKQPVRTREQRRGGHD